MLVAAATSNVWRPAVLRPQQIMYCQCLTKPPAGIAKLEFEFTHLTGPTPFHASCTRFAVPGPCRLKCLRAPGIGASRLLRRRNQHRWRKRFRHPQVGGPEGNPATHELKFLTIFRNHPHHRPFHCCSNASLDSDLSAVVEKLRKAKAAIDEGDANGAGPISW